MPHADLAEFWSLVADRYDRVIDRQLGGSTRARVRERLAREGPFGRLAEFGCGTGYFTSVLAGRCASLLATDVAAGMLEIARRQVRAPNVTFEAHDCERTSLADAQLDAVFLGLVLHFTEPVVTLREMRRILKPSGLLLIASLDLRALPAVARLRAILRITARGLLVYRTRPPKRFGRNVVTLDELGGLLAASGFRLESAERVSDDARRSSVPIDYVRARRE